MRSLVLLGWFLILGVCAQDPLHLCTKITTGRFDRIKFKSITWYEDTLVFFESDRKYYIPASHLATSRFSVPLGRFRSWNVDEMRWAVERMKPEGKMSAVYMLEQRWTAGGALDVDHWMQPSKKIRVGLNVVTVEKEYMWSIYWTKPLAMIGHVSSLFKPTEVWKEATRVHPDYSIIHHTNRSGASGWVIHKDIYSNNTPFIVYDLNRLNWNLRLNIHRYDASTAERTSAGYFYLEKTDKPSEVLLVHRQNIDVDRRRHGPHESGNNKWWWIGWPTFGRPRLGDQWSRSLFKHLPVGYRHNGSVYLFEAELGCVYLINDFGHLGPAYHSAPVKDQFRSRVNIPYEQFFRCNRRLYPLKSTLSLRHPANRCETRYIRPYWPIWREDRLARPVVVRIVLAVAIALAVIAVILGVIWWIKKAKKKQEDVGAVSGPKDEGVNTETSRRLKNSASQGLKELILKVDEALQKKDQSTDVDSIDGSSPRLYQLLERGSETSSKTPPKKKKKEATKTTPKRKKHQRKGKQPQPTVTMSVVL